MNREIVFIKIEKILDHPAQERHYGKTKIDKELAESIKLRGILQPLLLGQIEDDEALYCISGHRRKLCAKEAGLSAVPAEIKLYTAEEFGEISEMDLVISNKTRIKTDRQIATEIETMKQKLGRFKQFIKSNRLANMSETELEGFWSRNQSLKQIAESMITGGYNEREVLANKLGVPDNVVKQLRCIFDPDYQKKKLDKLKELNPKKFPAISKSFLAEWDLARDALDNYDKVSRTEAYKAIQSLIKDAEKKLSPSKKTPKKNTPKKTAPKLFAKVIYIGYEPVMQYELNKEFEFQILENEKTSAKAMAIRHNGDMFNIAHDKFLALIKKEIA